MNNTKGNNLSYKCMFNAFTRSKIKRTFLNFFLEKLKISSFNEVFTIGKKKNH